MIYISSKQNSISFPIIVPLKLSIGLLSIVYLPLVAITTSYRYMQASLCMHALITVLYIFQDSVSSAADYLVYLVETTGISLNWEKKSSLQRSMK